MGASEHLQQNSSGRGQNEDAEMVRQGAELDFEQVYKIVLVGEPSVGKTQFIRRCVNKVFEENSQSTLGVDFYCMTHDQPKKSDPTRTSKIKVMIWDTAGQEKFATVASMLYKGAKEQALPDCVITLVGNKSDLSHLRAVDYDDALAFAQERNMDFYETSALSNLNVESTLKGMVNKIYAQSDSDVENEYPKPTRNLGGNMNADNGENFCCLF